MAKEHSKSKSAAQNKIPPKRKNVLTDQNVYKGIPTPSKAPAKVENLDKGTSKKKVKVSFEKMFTKSRKKDISKDINRNEI